MKKETKLFVCAGSLMLVAGVIFGILNQWVFTALLGVGALGCLVAALNFENPKNR